MASWQCHNDAQLVRREAGQGFDARLKHLVDAPATQMRLNRSISRHCCGQNVSHRARVREKEVHLPCRCFHHGLFELRMGEERNVNHEPPAACTQSASVPIRYKVPLALDHLKRICLHFRPELPDDNGFLCPYRL